MPGGDVDTTMRAMLAAMGVSIKDGGAEAARTAKQRLSAALDDASTRVDRLRDLLVVATDPDAAEGLALALTRTRDGVSASIKAAANTPGCTMEGLNARIDASAKRGGKRLPESVRVVLLALKVDAPAFAALVSPASPAPDASASIPEAATETAPDASPEAGAGDDIDPTGMDTSKVWQDADTEAAALA